jgi:hypothetical protein
MLLALMTLLASALLQDPVQQAPPPAPPAPPAPSQWTTSLSTYWIEPPHASGYLSAVLAADRGPLHLEAHWAYEDRDTFSVFAGKSFPIEGELSGHFTPRIGVAGGNSEGIVPAMALALDWKALSFSTDVEYMIGTSSDTSDFLYSWNELSYALSDRFHVGLVGQRTNVFDQELTVDRGLLFGVSFGRSALTAYVFNPDLDDPYVTIAFGTGF